MGVQRVTLVTVTCDECGKEVELSESDEWVDASVYGVTFHVACWERIGGPRVARVLYLDDISVRLGEDGLPVRRAMGERDD